VSDEPDIGALAVNLRAARERAGLTRAEVVEATGTDYDRIEDGHTDPGLVALARIAETLGTTAADLLRGVE
jgi:transcriptional regulator with XRE-family HTH domain